MAEGAAGAEERGQPRSPGLAPRPHNAPVEGPAVPAGHGQRLPPGPAPLRSAPLTHHGAAAGWEPAQPGPAASVPPAPLR